MSEVKLTEVKIKIYVQVSRSRKSVTDDKCDGVSIDGLSKIPCNYPKPANNTVAPRYNEQVGRQKALLVISKLVISKNACKRMGKFFLENLSIY